MRIGTGRYRQLPQRLNAIIEHGSRSILALKSTIQFYVNNKVKAYEKKIRKKEKKAVEYKKLLVEVAPRLEKIYRKLNS